MSTHVAVNTYTYSVTFLSEKILHSLKEIIRESGLDPAKLAGSWASTQRAMSTWLNTRDLYAVTLEVYKPSSDKLVLRWDIDVVYDAADGDGSMWVDNDDLYYAIKKAGVAPSACKYDVILRTRNGRPDVEGWSSCEFRSTEGMSRHAIGTMANASNGLGARAAYWSHQ
ncbi:HORMA domain containing protein [Rhodopirellula bahusiensis]|uniref:HORMA domain containing protein n=1 Tax=Rhodopirellula bahusiensis TaxID=2014065 RepID=UPI003263DFA8